MPGSGTSQNREFMERFLMLEEELSFADTRQTLGSALLPDERTNAFAVIDQGQVRKITQTDHHGAIARFDLIPVVPIAVRIHFERAKTLYLSAWFSPARWIWRIERLNWPAQSR